MIYLGYDPGGIKAGGLAVLEILNNTVRYLTATVSSVDEGINWLRYQVGDEVPIGAGIDTLLYWETGKSGWRASDVWLRETYPRAKRSVFSSNSARGAMVVQGMALALRLKELWPEIKLSETHPKVLYHALSGKLYDWPSDMDPWLISEMGCPKGPEIVNDHEWDALISAWAVMRGNSGCWSTDLVELSTNHILPAGSVSYWWPD